MTNKDICIVIPSFNESRNIAQVIRGIRRELSGVRIIVVDDSDIGENKLTRKAINKFKSIDLISREKKKGRGSAVIDGFKYAFKNDANLYFFEMDADQAHEPKHLKRFLKKISDGNYGMIIGSRYVKGGQTGEITQTRKILSRIINKFLSLVLEIKLSDYTSGYRLYHRSAVEFIISQKMKSVGFITLSEITHKLNKHGFKIGEVPVTITKRKYGESTLGIAELIMSLIFILRMKLEDN